jgi:cytochrome c-type biogenesis protein CcmF
MFKIAGAWASHEGSMLLWVALLSLVGSVAVSIEDRLAGILSFIQILFLSFIYFTSNPFISLTFKPEEGMGLNPLLQDSALVIHPPILYLGYVTTVIPFSLSLLALTQNKIDEEVLRLMRVFSSLSLSCMTAGIALGSWWAYRELGWGGFWFFDPVENVSIMPWISGIALHHSLLVTTKSRGYLNWTLTLAILTFLLVILGTFLTRSGILTSVHSFAFSPERGLYVLVLFAIISIPSIFLLAVHNIEVPKAPLSFKKLGIGLGNMNWMLSLIILVAATLYPVFYSIFFKVEITVSPEFFIKIFVPSLILAIFMAGVFSYRSLKKDHLVSFLSALILTLSFSFFYPISLMIGAGIYSAIFLLFQTIRFILIKTNYLKAGLPGNSIALALGHLGIGLVLLSISLNSALQKEVEFIGKSGTLRQEQGFVVTLKQIYFAQGPNYYRQIAEFWIEDRVNNRLTVLKPENRLYKIEQTLSQESDIYSYLTADYYAVLSKVDGDIVHAKIYYRPMISFLWLSAFIVCSGFMVSFIRSIVIYFKK